MLRQLTTRFDIFVKFSQVDARKTTRKSRRERTKEGLKKHRNMAAAIALRLSSLDALRVARGHCLSCEWCPRFLSPSKRILCDYCGCPPAKHQRLDNDNQKGNSSSSKKIKLTDMASSSGTPSSEDDDEDEDDLDAGEMDARPPSPP